MSCGVADISYLVKIRDNPWLKENVAGINRFFTLKTAIFIFAKGICKLTEQIPSLQESFPLSKIRMQIYISNPIFSEKICERTSAVSFSKDGFRLSKIDL
jgi:hypothetical protein